MTYLADLAHHDTRSWAEARQRFSWPPVRQYNIAADCLHADPARTALIAVEGRGTRRISYVELDDLTARFGTALRGLGVTPGDRVAIRLSQSVEMAVAVLAVLRIGAVAVPISTVLGEDAVRHRLADSAPRVLVSSGSEQDTALAAEVDTVAVGVDETSGAKSMGQLVAAASRGTGEILPTGPDTPALLLYTSGTTGKSKGVLHGHRVLLGHHAIDLAWDHVRADDVAYSPVDWAWAGGLLLGLLVPLAYGMSVVAYRQARFDPERTIEIMRDEGVSVGLFPPTALRMLRDSHRLGAGSIRSLRLRSMITGAEAVEPELADWARTELDVAINNAFGQTEANALIGHSTVLGALDPACLGVAYPGHQVAILDSARHEVPAGETGEIAVRADDPVCMLRYWQAPEATAEKVRDGWLLTGDLAHADDDGRIYFHGRADDIIKSGGYRLGPAEIEAAILSHPAAAECAVVGTPDPVRGQTVTAYVRLAPGQVANLDLTRQLQEKVRAMVGAHAYPRVVRYVTDLPRTSTGKIDRRALRTSAGHAGMPDREVAG